VIGEPRRIAYADPPYPGLSRRYYRDHPDYAGEVDHAQLVESLESSYDGWALSTSARSLRDVLAVCPPHVRVAAWHRGERPTVSRHPLTAWEPVLYVPARVGVPLEAYATRRVDSLVYHARPRRTGQRVIGAKPARFAGWLFQLLGALPADEFLDLFPGSGGIGRAWDAFRRASTGSGSDGCESHKRVVTCT
jgi:hypothetical protein